MRLSGAGVKRFYNPVKLNFTEWGNWEAIILEAVGNRKALLMTVGREGAKGALGEGRGCRNAQHSTHQTPTLPHAKQIVPPS